MKMTGALKDRMKKSFKLKILTIKELEGKKIKKKQRK